MYQVKSHVNQMIRIKTDEIYCEAVNIDRLSDKLQSIPYELHEDIAVIYYFQEKTAEGFLTVPVSYEILNILGMSSNELRKCAWKNTITKKQAVFQSLMDVIGLKDDSVPLYVLTNEEMRLGAVTIFYPDLLDMIAEGFDADLCVIPASIHECIIFPIDKDYDAKNVRMIIKNVNDQEVSPDEILSYNVYRYTRSDKAIAIDNS